MPLEIGNVLFVFRGQEFLPRFMKSKSDITVTDEEWIIINYEKRTMLLQNVQRDRERERERESELTNTTPKQSYCKIEKSWLFSFEFDVWTRPQQKKKRKINQLFSCQKLKMIEIFSPISLR